VSNLVKLPGLDVPLVDKRDAPTPIWRNYLVALDQVVRTGNFGPLVNAVSDVAAAAAGVPVGGLYRNGNAVQVRLV
jgi:hypothetical protein